MSTCTAPRAFMATSAVRQIHTLVKPLPTRRVGIPSSPQRLFSSLARTNKTFTTKPSPSTSLLLFASKPTSATRMIQQPSLGLLSQQNRGFSLFKNDPTVPEMQPKPVINDNIPEQLLHEIHPIPMREEFKTKKRLTTQDLEAIPINLGYHREPSGWSDRIAYEIVKSLRIPVDLFFRTKYIHRVVMLETVAAVPGMVAGTLRHLRSLRRCTHDGGWISHLLHEAENERMHLLTWMKIAQPTLFERFLVTSVQGVFYNVFFGLYLLSDKTAHRVVGYLEEQAVISYTHMLDEIAAGVLENGPAPQIAIDYWHLENTATVRDVCLAIRADEAVHRDSNHHFSDRLERGPEFEDLRVDIRKLSEEAAQAGQKVKELKHTQKAEEIWSKGDKY